MHTNTNLNVQNTFSVAPRKNVMSVVLQPNWQMKMLILEDLAKPSVGSESIGRLQKL